MSSLFDLPFEDPEATDDASTADTLPGGRRVLSVTQLTSHIRGLLEEQLFEVWVEGELSNCRVWNTGHMYFTLKDGGAQIRGVMFRSAVRMLRFTPEDGQHVVARGRVSVYEPKGEYQLVCEHLEPAGLGALQLAFTQLKTRLAQEGLFDSARKRSLPTLPRKIGVVTSLDGAAIRDILKVLRRRHARTHIVIRPTRVQGEGSAREIARALGAIARVPGVDVVIVGRGGGSIEDLWAFNEEVVARAIASCPVPTIAAVGHETDVTIADFVADVRAATPSAAAEIVIGRADEFATRIDRLTERLAASVRGRMYRLEARLRALEARRGLAGFPGRLAMRARRADELLFSLRRAIRRTVASRERSLQAWRLALEANNVRSRLIAIRTRVTAADERLARSGRRRVDLAQTRLVRAAARLDALSPLAVLGRGYALCWDAAHASLVRDASGVEPGQRVHVRLERGEIACDVVSRTTPDTQSTTRE